MLRDSYVDFIGSCVSGELLKLRGDKTDKAVDLYKSCIDESKSPL